MKKLSSRQLRFLELAKTVPYTDEELEMLHSLCHEYAKPKVDFWWEGSSEEVIFDLYFRMGAFFSQKPGYRHTVKNGWVPKYPEIPKHLKSETLNLLQYFLTYNRKVFLFLACVPLNQIPLYFETPVIKIFAQWRLQIQK